MSVREGAEAEAAETGAFYRVFGKFLIGSTKEISGFIRVCSCGFLVVVLLVFCLVFNGGCMICMGFMF